MRKTIVCVILFMLVIQTLSLTVRTTEVHAAPGDSPADPIIIMNAQQLSDIRNSLSKHYKLGRDIDLSGYDFDGAGPDNGGWMPIGTSSSPFKGTLDGNGYVIRNMTIDRPLIPVGLFGVIGANAQLMNIRLLDINVTGRGEPGISAPGGALVGNLLSGSTIRNSIATGRISMSGPDAAAGGLAGVNVGTIENSYALVHVSGGSWRHGGLVGTNAGTIRNSYAAGNVIGDREVGGLVGYHNSGSIENSYAAGHVTGSSGVGGLVGRNDTGNAFPGSYWNKDTSGQSASAGGTLITTEGMKVTNIFTGWDTSFWGYSDGDRYPYLLAFKPGLAVDPLVVTLYNLSPGQNELSVTGTVYNVSIGEHLTVDYTIRDSSNATVTTVTYSVYADGRAQSIGRTIPLAGLGSGTYTLHITVKDTYNPIVAAPQLAFTIDATRPTVNLSGPAVSTVNVPFPITVTFSEAVAGFEASDIVIGNGTASNFNAVSEAVYTATVTPTTSDQAVTVNVAADAATDAAANGNTESNTLSVMYDPTKPTVTLSSTAGATVNAAFPITVTFSEAVTGFDANDIDVGNSTVSNFIAVSASDYTATITPITRGQAVTVHVAAGAATDAAANSSTVSNTLSFMYDSTKPTVAISSTASSMVNASFPVTVTFSEAVAGFDANDIVVDNGTVSNFNADHAPVYTATVTPTTSGQAVTVKVAADAATDAAANGNTESNTLSFMYDSTKPRVALSSIVGATVNAAFPITVTFSEAVTNFDVNDIVVGNGTVSNFNADHATVYTATITPTTSGQAVTVNVAAGVADDAAANSSTESNILSFMYDSTKPTVALSSTAGTTVSAAFPITVTFSEAVTDFDVNDIVVGNGTVSNFNADHAPVYTATITPTTSGQAVTVNVAAGVAADAAANSSTESNILSFMYDTTKPTVSFGGFTANQIFTGSPASITVSVNEPVYRVADGKLFTSSDALSLFSMEKDSTAFSNYTASYDEPSRTYTFTFNNPLQDGTYKVKVTGNVVENAYHNTLDEATASFTVAVPVVSNITMNPATLARSGGSTTATLTGSNLMGQSVKIYMDGTEAATATIKSATSAEATVAIPPNTDTSRKTYTLTVYLNGAEVAGKSTTVTVNGESGGYGGYDSEPAEPAVAGPIIDPNGVTLDPDKIDTSKPSVTLETTPKDGVAFVSIPASILTNLEGKNAAFLIEIKTPYGSYQVPVNLASLIPGLQELLAANNLKAEDISFKVTLTDKSGDRDIVTAFDSDLPNGKVLGAIVDFNIEIIVIKSGQTIGTADKFSQALTRVIPMPKNVNGLPEQWGAFRFNETTGTFEFVAAEKVQIDDVWYVMIRSHSNSVYVVAENTVSFTDVHNHWSGSFVRLAAAKGLVDGVGDGLYDPDRTVTRAEFTAMLIRALGRGKSTANTAPYHDVKSGAWYFEAVVKAKELGLLKYVTDNSFKPDQPLTREEMASMLATVISLEKLLNIKERVSLNGYKDIGKVDKAYLDDVRTMVTLQIMTGTDEGTFNPKGETTRAQAAVVFIRTLQKLGLIN
ncbi:S-layer homology domain-containing protein [Paenibacillus mesophilus]|uniref:Ig-like domain-containing protein n=1 Tax=Paenibacillus mesophilus TaxID=2582849 RepID=UPI00110E3C40|nr:Ig-like domain-containing protein [Paenibacillus mesophilus]TMV48360.1 S-layer homology domain-containing protein [Paenibacillus mesophilus]